MHRACTALFSLLLLASILPPLPASAGAAAHSPAAKTQAAGTVCQELVHNGGFEDGPVAWAQTSSPTANLIIRNSSAAHSGSWVAHLGDRVNSDDELTQPILLPAGTLTVTLRFWWFMWTDEPAGSGTADTLTVALLGPDGQPIGVPALVDNASTLGLWQPADVALTGWHGSPLTLSLHAINDSISPTGFFVDDISVIACVGQQHVYLPLVRR